MGGGEARPNTCYALMPDGTEHAIAKSTHFHMAKGAVPQMRTGGGYGDPAERPVAAVLHDIAEGCITEDHARRHDPRAFT